MDYSEFVLSQCPATGIYIPNFLTSYEEQRMFERVQDAPKPKWTQLTHRRLINYGGVPHHNGMIAEQIPDWLQTYVDKINNLGVFECKNANHVLVNEYLPGQGIMPHLDGPLFYPIISTISLGSHTIIEFSKRSDSVTDSTVCLANNSNDCAETGQLPAPVMFKIIVEPRSLLILKDTLYHEYMHAIGAVTEDIVDDKLCNLRECENTYKFGERLPRTTRISLTIRHVPKTSKMKLHIGK